MSTPSYPLADDFDALLTDTGDILKKGSAPTGKYRQPSQDLTPLATAIACRVSTKALGRPHEQAQEFQASENFRTIYMRPFEGLTPHNWMRIDSALYDIFEVKIVKNLDSTPHHYELIAKLVIA